MRKKLIIFALHEIGTWFEKIKSTTQVKNLLTLSKPMIAKGNFTSVQDLLSALLASTQEKINSFQESLLLELLSISNDASSTQEPEMNDLYEIPYMISLKSGGKLALLEIADQIYTQLGKFDCADLLIDFNCTVSNSSSKSDITIPHLAILLANRPLVLKLMSLTSNPEEFNALYKREVLDVSEEILKNLADKNHSTTANDKHIEYKHDDNMASINKTASAATASSVSSSSSSAVSTASSDKKLQVCKKSLWKGIDLNTTIPINIIPTGSGSVSSSEVKKNEEPDLFNVYLKYTDPVIKNPGTFVRQTIVSYFMTQHNPYYRSASSVGIKSGKLHRPESAMFRPLSRKMRSPSPSPSPIANNLMIPVNTNVLNSTSPQTGVEINQSLPALQLDTDRKGNDSSFTPPPDLARSHSEPAVYKIIKGKKYRIIGDRKFLVKSSPKTPHSSDTLPQAPSAVRAQSHEAATKNRSSAHSNPSPSSAPQANSSPLSDSSMPTSTDIMSSGLISISLATIGAQSGINSTSTISPSALSTSPTPSMLFLAPSVYARMSPLPTLVEGNSPESPPENKSSASSANQSISPPKSNAKLLDPPASSSLLTQSEQVIFQPKARSPSRGIAAELEHRSPSKSPGKNSGAGAGI